MIQTSANQDTVPLRLTVSQIRVAASCPRIAYFDAVETRRRGLNPPLVTRIWKPSNESEHAGLGGLFHQTVERFSSAARNSEGFWNLLVEPLQVDQLTERLLLHVFCDHLSRPRLYAASGEQQQSFMRALDWYVTELAEMICYARLAGIPPAELREQLFGDQRRQVDVTFAVGPDDVSVNVHGRLDYLFYDWRTTRRRIVDYKLTPADHPRNDIFQISLYALMHHVQHHTEPDAAVLYLHPRRVLEERPWEEIQAARHETYDFLASVGAWLKYDEQSGRGLKPPGDPTYCSTCPWREQCTARLGPKHEGNWLTHWRDRARVAASGPEPISPPEPQIIASAVGPPESLCLRNDQLNESAAGEHGAPHLIIGRWENDDADVVIPTEALVTHALVAGAAGSGKTWLAKVILEESIRCGGAVIAIDPQGDLVQLAIRRDPSELTAHERLAFEQFEQRSEVRIWTPGSSIAKRLRLDPLRLPNDDELLGIDDPQRRRDESEHLLQTAAANLVDLARASGEPDSQQTFLLEVLRRLTSRHRGLVTLHAVTDAVHDPTQLGIKDANRWVRKAERERLARKLSNFLRGPNAALFTEGEVLDVDRLLTPSMPGRTTLNVIYLNHLIDDDQKQFVVAAIANEIYRWMISRSPTQGPLLTFYLDEAREFLPAGNRQTAAKQPLRRLFSQGRKYQVGCVVAAQSPRSVEYEALSNCSTKLIGRLESQQDVERVREWFSRDGRAPEWLASRKGAAAGSFLGRWPGMDPEREGQSLRSRMLFTQHAGAWSPDQLEHEMRSRPA